MSRPNNQGRDMFYAKKPAKSWRAMFNERLYFSFNVEAEAKNENPSPESGPMIISYWGEPQNFGISVEFYMKLPTGLSFFKKKIRLLDSAQYVKVTYLGLMRWGTLNMLNQW